MSTPYQAFELTFEERDKYLYARITSKAITLERSQKYLSAIIDKCRELGVSRLMIERHIPQTLSNVEAYRLVTELSENMPPDLRIAMVDANGNNRKRLEFGTRAARSQQLDAEVFGTVEEAEKWLSRD
jgi:hypothetical protein